MWSLHLCIITHIVPVLCNFNCVTRKSTKSGTSHHDTASIECNPGETLVSCGFFTYDSFDEKVDGTDVININSEANECVAFNGNDNSGSYAYARCCTFISNDIHCTGYSPDIWVDDDDDRTNIKCSDIGKQYITGCSSYATEGRIDGAFPGTLDPQNADKNINYPLTDQSCTHQSGTGHGESKASLICCDSPIYPLECVIKYSEQSDYATVKCDTEYTMIGCSGWGKWNNLNGWGIIDDECVARAPDDEGASVWSTATCCKLGEIISIAPTMQTMQSTLHSMDISFNLTSNHVYDTNVGVTEAEETVFDINKDRNDMPDLTFISGIVVITLTGCIIVLFGFIVIHCVKETRKRMRKNRKQNGSAMIVKSNKKQVVDPMQGLPPRPQSPQICAVTKTGTESDSDDSIAMVPTKGCHQTTRDLNTVDNVPDDNDSDSIYDSVDVNNIEGLAIA